MGPVRLAVAGAGVIGKRHIEEVDASSRRNTGLDR